MLPGVNAEEGLKSASNRVLVRSGDDGQSSRVLVLDEPGPSGALDTSKGGVGLLLEGLKGAKVFVDSSHELTLRLTTTALAVGSKVLPEERVVDVTTAVEVEKRSLSGSSLGIALVVGLSESVGSVVEAGDVGLMVLGVVKLHDLTRDVRLKSAIVVWAICQLAVLDRRIEDWGNVQGRSGRVALLRTKLVVAMAARGVERARRPARRAGVDRRRAEAMLEAILMKGISKLNRVVINADDKSNQDVCYEKTKQLKSQNLQKSRN